MILQLAGTSARPVSPAPARAPKRPAASKPAAGKGNQAKKRKGGPQDAGSFPLPRIQDVGFRIFFLDLICYIWGVMKWVPSLQSGKG